MPFWAVARTKPNAENIATRNLENQRFEYYQPKILEKKVKQGKTKMVEQPLFPCYLFVRVHDSWRSLQYTYGIAGVISNGSMPAIVGDQIINDLKSREIHGYIQLPKPKHIQVGDTVKINDPRFEGQTALVERMPATERQKVLLALLGNKIRILIPESDLELVSGEQAVHP
jgi:transcriptional antiterminator RfaH